MRGLRTSNECLNDMEIVLQKERHKHKKKEPQMEMISRQFWDPRLVCTKMDVQDVYRLRFGRSLYVWKGNN